MMFKKGAGVFEIYLLIVGVVAFSYLIGGSGIVSAEEGNVGLQTCLEDNSGSFCQEYSSAECDSQCTSSCLPTRRDQTNECVTGYCYDSSEGTCSGNTPKIVCEDNGGVWSSEEPDECKLNCCLIGDEAIFTTERQCQTISDRTGIEILDYTPVNNEIECLAMANSEEEGACVLYDSAEDVNNCRFVTRRECGSLQGDFHVGWLCSKDSLNTVCEKQDRTGCVDGLDGVYWFDSCGNRENIYDSNKVRSWNNGVVLPRDESCELGTRNNPFSRQSDCGNCDYLLGSVCGTPLTEDKDASVGDYVCRDLNCIDENGVERQHGESWCVFDSQIGVQGSDGTNEQRSIDVPGSSHYRQVCYEGEITTETCQSGRREVCVENEDDNTGFSSAACRINQWSKCMDISQEYFDSADGEGNLDETILEECEKYTDCFVKNVEISDKFKFSMCVPKYPPGFDLSERGGDVAEGICAMGTQKCTYVKIKELFGSKKINEECTRPEFTETMNNLCMSLGDCGLQVNVAGEETDDGYRVDGAPGLSQRYINELKRYINPGEGQSADPLTDEEIATLFGYDISDPNYSPSSLGDSLGMIGLGTTGVFLAYQAYNLGVEGAYVAIGKGGFAFSSAQYPGLSAFGNAAAGAGAGATIGYLVGKAFGLQGDALTAVTLSGLAAGIGYTIATAYSIGSAAAAAVSAAGSAVAGGVVATGTAIGATFSTVPGLGAVGQLTGNFAAAYVNYASGLAAQAASSAATSSALAGGSVAQAGAAAQAAASSSLAGAGIPAQLSTSISAAAAEGVAGSGATSGVAGGVGIFSMSFLLVTIAIAVVAALFIKFVLKVGSVEKKTIEFECLPWQAPQGGDDCGECGADGLPCTKYKCESLGQTCELINEGGSDQECIDVAPDDSSAPEIEPNEAVLLGSLSYTSVGDNGFRITSDSSDGCVPEFSSVMFGLTLDEPGQCKIDVENGKSFEDMEGFLGGSNLYTREHAMSYVMPSLALLGASGADFDPDRQADFGINVRCSDLSGNVNERDYRIEFCVSPQDDATAPLIMRFNPNPGSFVAWNETSSDMTFFTDEPAECKWSSSDIAYELMENEISCSNEIEDMSLYGFECGATLPVSDSGEDNVYFIKCEDQPWLEVDNPEGKERNVNSQSYVYSLLRSESELSIARVSPYNETIISGSVPASVEIEVETAGGAEGTVKTCEYGWGDYYSLFVSSSGNTHRQIFDSLIDARHYNIPVRCEDEAGNTASDVIEFDLSIDTQGPEITRVYRIGGDLTVITNEDSECAYDLGDLGFTFDEGEMMSGTELIHKATLEKGLEYHVKCKDSFGNLGQGLVVSGGLF